MSWAARLRLLSAEHGCGQEACPTEPQGRPPTRGDAREIATNEAVTAAQDAPAEAAVAIVVASADHAPPECVGQPSVSDRRQLLRLVASLVCDTTGGEEPVDTSIGGDGGDGGGPSDVAAFIQVDSQGGSTTTQTHGQIVSAVGELLHKVSEACGRAPQDVLGEVSAQVQSDIAHSYLSGETAMATTKVESMGFGITPPALQRHRRVLAMTALATHRSHAAQAMQHVVDRTVACGGRLLCFSEYLSCDETPVDTRVKDTQAATYAATLAGSCGGGAEVLVLPTIRDAVPKAKILSSVWHYSLLVEVSGCIVNLVFDVATVRQAMEGKSADIYYQCFRQGRPHLGSIPQQFERRQMLASTDGDAAIEKALRAYVDPGSNGGVLMQSKCVVHRFANMQTKVMRHCDGEISKTLHIALSLRYGAMDRR